MLAPVVMGTIAQQQGGRALDASGIAGFLSSQKDSIAAALPSGFGNLLGGTGLLNSLGNAARTSGSEATRTATSAAYAVGTASQRAARATASASLNWLYWLIPAAAVAALLVYLFTRPAEQVVQQGATAVQSMTVDGLDVRQQVTDSVSSLRATVGDITDATSAQAALPKLREVTAQVDKIGGMLGRLSAEQPEGVLAGLVKSDDADAQSTVRQGSRDPGCCRGHQAHY